MNFPPYGDEFRKENAHIATLKVKPRKNPNMSVEVTPGGFWANGNKYVDFSGGISPMIQIPQGGTRISLVTINYSGHIVIVNGQTSSNPVAPECPRSSFPLAFIIINSSSTQITQDMIYDVRGFFASVTSSHHDLQDRDKPAAHPISAIEGLQDALNQTINGSDLTSQITAKADKDGTIENTFKINKDATGTPVSDCYLLFERGALADVGFKWNESLNTLQYTNDGSTWVNLTDEGLSLSLPIATSGVLGGVKIGANINVSPDGTISVPSGTTDNNFTDVYKAKLDGIEESANNYTHPATHPATMITEDSTRQFITSVQKSKLDGIEEGANNYTHPTNHVATMITEDATHRFVTDIEKSTWNNKQDAFAYVPENITNKGVPGGYASLDGSGKVPATQLPDLGSTTTVVNNIAERDGLTAHEGYKAHVVDASADSSVTSGSAGYIYDGSSWVKMYESEGLDAVIEWANIQSKPTEFTPAVHSHDGVYEPVDPMILRQSNLVGTGVAVTPAKSDHNHDGTYAAVSHNHDGTYEPIDSTILRYTDLSGSGVSNSPARSDHDHSGSYAPIGHHHDGLYATISHDHTGVYEPVDATILRQANLTGTGSATTPAKSDHNHDSTYAAVSHNHDANYAPVTHNHDSLYAAETKTIYVDKNGNDSTGNGSMTKPFQSIMVAIAAAESLTPDHNNPIVIYIGPGIYDEAVDIKQRGISLEGCGQLLTFIRYNGTALTVRNDGSTPCPTDVKITNIAIQSTDNAQYSVRIEGIAGNSLAGQEIQFRGSRILGTLGVYCNLANYINFQNTMVDGTQNYVQTAGIWVEHSEFVGAVTLNYDDSGDKPSDTGNYGLNLIGAILRVEPVLTNQGFVNDNFRWYEYDDIKESIIPGTNNSHDLGSDTNKWKDIKAAGTIDAGIFSVLGAPGIDQTISFSDSGGTTHNLTFTKGILTAYTTT